MVYSKDDTDLPPQLAAKRTIQFGDEEIQPVATRDPEAGPVPVPVGHRNSIHWGTLPKMNRNDTRDSIRSVRSVTSRNNDPSLALPTIYRTVSFNITASQERQREEATKEAAKAKAQAGDGKNALHSQTKNKVLTSSTRLRGR